jgi:hypothetical protein
MPEGSDKIIWTEYTQQKMEENVSIRRHKSRNYWTWYNSSLPDITVNVEVLNIHFHSMFLKIEINK